MINKFIALVTKLHLRFDSRLTILSKCVELFLWLGRHQNISISEFKIVVNHIIKRAEKSNRTVCDSFTGVHIDEGLKISKG